MTSKSTYSDPLNNSSDHQAGINPEQPKPDPLAADGEIPAGDPALGYLHGREPKGLKILARQKALHQISDHGKSDLGVEVGGLLLGSVKKGMDELKINILATIPVTSQDHGPVHFTFTADAWSQVNRERMERFPDLDVVGWYHTHPGLGVFFSADDVVVQKAAFVMPWHVALVVDPIRKQGCFFGWKSDRENENNAIVPISGFWEEPDEVQAESRTWDYVHGSVWSENRLSQYSRAVPSQIYSPDGESTLLPPINPWWGVLLGGLSLLISLLLLLDKLFAATP